MRTTINIDDELLASAQKYTGEKEKTKLVRMGLESLIQTHVARRLIALGGTDPHATAAPRRRAWKRR
ncbi:MAG: type II toxin-antitoxin system VapB family antitoxin [Verrucomicrobiota bacterium]|nr:type II toxin-antitoxin system VapB family antitoxin [Verrucomicrobiota bacterium]